MTRRPLPHCPATHAYFLDIDGTLVDLADSPSEIRVTARLLSVIDALRRKAGGAVAMISGRPLAEVDRIFCGLHRLPAAGQHGAERRSASGRVHHLRVPAAPLNRARRTVSEALIAHPRLWLEDKGASLALHYRSAPTMAGTATRIMAAACRAAGPRYVLQRGKRVIELRPTGRDKGSTIEAFMRESPFKGRVPIFIGDDVTDETGFDAVNRLRGISIKVGRGVTCAEWRLADSRAVIAWLAAGVR